MSSDAELVRIVDAAVAAWLAGELLTCRSGCTHCGIGPFAVTERDLERLRTGNAMAPGERREGMALRSAEARAALRDGFPGDWTAGRVAKQDAADAFDLQPCQLNYTGADAANFRVSFTTPETEASPLTYVAWAALESESRVQVA